MIYVCRIYAKLQIFYLQDSNLYWSLIELGDPNRLMPRPPILRMLVVVVVVIISTTMDELVGLLQFGCCNLSLLNLSVVWGQRSW